MSTLGELAKSYQDAWLADHQQAMACLDLEEKIALGSFLFELITKVDERYRLQVLQGQEEYREEFSRSVLELYRQWSSPCRKALEEIAAMENSGFVLRGAETFRSQCREVQGILTDDHEFFDSDALAELRDKAIDELLKGQASEFGAT